MTELRNEDMVNVPTEKMSINAKDVILGKEQRAKILDGSERLDTRSSHSGVTGDILAKHNGYPYYLIGGGGGMSFDDIKYDQGIVVTGIEAWAGGWQLRGIRISFSDGSSVIRGRCEESYCGGINLDYLSGEVVTELSIWGNGAGTRCGAFRIKTSMNREFFPKMTSWGLKTEYRMNAGGGVILGIIGRAGSDIDCLGFVMLDTVNSRVLTQFEYDLNKIPLPEEKKAYDVTIPNSSNSNSDKGSVTREIKISKGGEWFIKAGLKFGQEFSVKGGIPQIADFGATSKWEVSVESGYTNKWDRSESDSITVPLIVPALTKMRIVYSYFQGRVDSCPFVATMKYFLTGGGIWDCEVRGFYSGVDTTRVVGTCYLIARWENNTWVEEKNPIMMNLR